jgi:pimeloyl-ACP methyl ester carboxylesterase
LGGHSTGANKTALYHYLQPKNPFAGYVLYGGGDDTGLYYENLGPARYRKTLDTARQKVASGHGADLAPFEAMDDYFSYQSIVDILDPDGGYNTFPFYETQHQPLGKKPLWREYQSITKPTLVIYGERDEYALPDVLTALAILKRQAPPGIDFTFQTIPDGDHGCYQHEPELAQAIAAWLADQPNA